MRVSAALLFALSLAVPTGAQQPESAVEEIDATKLGVSLSRIQKGLRLASPSEQKSGTPLRLDFRIQVFGQAPKIDVFKDFDLINGQVPGVAPSHHEVIEFLTPQIFRAPVMPISAVMGWAAQQMWKRSNKANCEAEIANYRALLMQGVNVAAPRCTQ